LTYARYGYKNYKDVPPNPPMKDKNKANDGTPRAIKQIINTYIYI
jgi:hypothetical protein